MFTTSANVPTAHAARYLGQLCKHWAHRFQVDRTGDHAVVLLPDATLTLNAHPQVLEIQLASSAADNLDRMREIVREHVDGFAFREAPLSFDWRP